MAKIYLTLKFKGLDRSSNEYVRILVRQMVHRKKYPSNYLMMAFLGYAGDMDPAVAAFHFHLN